MIDFDTAIERVLSHEGGYVNNPADPGGETMWGIAKRSYPQLNIAALTRDDAKEIYRRDFWTSMGSLVADSALQFQLLDAAVNHGAGNAVRMLQRAVGVADDGHWGPTSHAALAALEPRDALDLFLAERLAFFTKLRAFDTFGRGWANRIAANLRFVALDT